MRIRSAVIALVLTGLGSAGSADATPYVGQSWESTAQIRLVGTDRNVYQVKITVTVTGQASSMEIREVDVSIARCRDGACGTGLVYSRVASASELAVSSDGSTITLRSSFGGSPLRVSWSGGTTADTRADIGAGPLTTTVGNGGSGGTKESVNVTLLSATCNDPSAESAKVVTVRSAGDSATGGAWLSKAPTGFTPKRGRRVTCVHAGTA